jgi:hypothetical protein
MTILSHECAPYSSERSFKMQAWEKSGKQEGDIRKLYKAVWKWHMSAV